MNNCQCNPRYAALALASASAFVFAACAGQAPIEHFYSVEVADPSAAIGSPLPGTLHVDPLRTDGLVGQRYLLYRQQEGSAEIRQHGHHRWTDPPAMALQTALVSFLRDAGAAETVMEANARIRPDYTLSGRVQRFERTLDGDAGVIVELDLTLTSARGALLVHEKYAEKRAASDISESASAVNDAVHAIFERFLVDLRREANQSVQSRQQ